MEKQNFGNHKRFDPKYHYMLSLLCIIVLVWSVVHLITSIQSGEMVGQAIVLVLMSIILGLLFVLVRQYPLKAQDRVIRAEQQLRHYILTGKPLDPRLSLKQIAGLRFAGDGEFPSLCKRAVEENLSGDAIKRAIKHWQADDDRI